MESTWNLPLRRITQILLFCASIFLVTRIALQIGSVANAPTVGFLFLILVLLSAFFGDLAVSIITSIVAALCFNFFFLPPIGTFNIAAVDDWVSLAAFLLTAIAISRLTSSAHDNAGKASNLDLTMSRLRDFGGWLLSIPHEELSLSAIAAKVVEMFGVEYCSIHIYFEGKWHHFSGAANNTLSSEVANNLKLKGDHSTNLMDIVDEHETGARYTEIKQGEVPLGLLVVKGLHSLPPKALGVIGNMIGVRIYEDVRESSSLDRNLSH